MLNEHFSRHFLVVHTFVSEEARRAYLTPPEYRDPPEERPTEHQWAFDAIGDFAQCMQTWVGNDDFLYCHWIAESEEDVYRQPEAFDLEGNVVSSMANEFFNSCPHIEIQIKFYGNTLKMVTSGDPTIQILLRK